MLYCCERTEQTPPLMLINYNIDLGEWGVWSVPTLIGKIVDKPHFMGKQHMKWMTVKSVG